MKTIAIIEKSSDTYSVYAEGYGFHGFGATEEEARLDFLDAYNEFREQLWCNDELEFDFRNLTELEAEREAYRVRCRNLGYEDMCLKDTGYYRPGLHMTFSCTGRCRRMKNWDKKHDYHGQP